MPQNDPKKRTLGGGAAPAGADAAMAGPQQAAATPPATPQQQAQQQPGTGFVNLQRVLEANRAGAQQMGGQLANQVRQQGQQAQQAVTSAQGAYTAALAAKADAMKYNPAANATLAKTAAPGARGDERLALLREQQAEATKLAGRTFDGPKDWESAGVDVPGLTSQVVKAQDAAQAVTSAGGRAALLREQNPGLTAGGASLDAFLAGHGMGTQAQELRSSFGGLADALKAARASGNEAYKSTVDTSKAEGKKYANLAAQLGAGVTAESAAQRERSWARGEPERQRTEEARRLDDGVLTWEEQERARDRKRGNRGGDF